MPALGHLLKDPPSPVGSFLVDLGVGLAAERLTCAGATSPCSGPPVPVVTEVTHALASGTGWGGEQTRRRAPMP